VETTDVTTIKRPTCPYLITIRFTVAGASYFAVLEHLASGKLRGMRWQPSRSRLGGEWGNLQTIDPDLITDRMPSCPRPHEPTMGDMEAAYAHEAKRRGDDKARDQLRRTIQERTKGGAKVEGRFTRPLWNSIARKWVEDAEPAIILGAEGRYAIIEGGHHGSYRVQLEAIRLVEGEA
jgi:hypothetical protein